MVAISAMLEIMGGLIYMFIMIFGHLVWAIVTYIFEAVALVGRFIAAVGTDIFGRCYYSIIKLIIRYKGKKE